MPGHNRTGEDHRSFLKRFELKLPPTDLERLDFAYDLSKYTHRNQFREGGERYFEHLRATALILVDELGVTDVELIIAALLHDTLEDGFLLTGQRIEIIFGDRVARITNTISKPRKDDKRFASPAERSAFYLKTIAQSDADTKLMKLCDRLHNLRTLHECSAEKQARKIAETRMHYVPLIEDIAHEHPEVGARLAILFEAALANLGQ